MSEWIAGVFERQFGIDPTRTVRGVQVLTVVGSAILFAAVATVIMSFNTFFLDRSVAALDIRDIAPRDIYAPLSLTWESEVLTEQGRVQEVAGVEDVYNLPDANVARQQTQIARQILDFINNIRRDPYGTTEQRIGDLQQITALDLSQGVLQNILEMDEETWRSVDEQIMDVLERVMQQSIREGDLPSVISRLPTQVSVRFNIQETGVITSVVGDLVRPNTFINLEQTDEARETASENFQPVSRTFVAGQRVVEQGNRLTPADLEALQQLGILDVSPEERRAALIADVSQSFMVSITALIVIGLFVARFSPDLFEQPRFVLLGALIYLLFLIGAQAVGGEGNAIYLYPVAGMALLFVAILTTDVAIITSLGLGLMVGFMLGQRLELSVLVVVSSLIGILSLRRAERLNSYFFAGLMIALANIAVIIMFNFDFAPLSFQSTEDANSLLQLIFFAGINGILSAAVAMALMYLVTIMFNLPTGLRLVELSQPNHPLLQRLLRDAPGTYQHSLQVANLAEQAASAIGANADLVRVSALYHDIGKSLNAPFFVENQADGVNPHDEMGDAHRSAAIIISHVTEGDKLARQNRLPSRVRDFIMEHHGTTRVEYFYRQAMSSADNSDEIDPSDFTYPGPIPQSRETAIMMLADGCESTVRARRPSSKQEIFEIVQGIIDARTRSGQLDESGLTSNDIKTIRSVFVDMLQAVFHPRINYPSGIESERPKTAVPETPVPTRTTVETTPAGVNGKRATDTTKTVQSVSSLPPEDEDEEVSPLPDVPPLPRKTDPKPDDDSSDAS
jgi:putative nucleotidyltransferase with HDIG domain